MNQPKEWEIDGEEDPPEDTEEDVERVQQIQENEPSHLAVGIDFGTRYVRYGVFRNDKFEASDMDAALFAQVAFNGDDKVVGKMPAKFGYDDATVVVGDLKRILGKDFLDPNFEEFVKSLPFQVVADPDTKRPIVKIPHEDEVMSFTAEELVAMLFGRVRDLVCKGTGENVVDAVVSVPGFFDNSQKQAMMDAGKIAGLNVIKIISEPAASAMTYNVENRTDGMVWALVFDMGAGKVDVSLVKFQGGECVVRKTAGTTEVGGIEIDKMLASAAGASCPGYEESPAAVRRLAKESERAKIKLSSADSAVISIVRFTDGKDLKYKVTRKDFDDMCDELFKKCMNPINEIFADCEVQKSDVKKVILVGGSTKIARLRFLIVQFFDNAVELVDQPSSSVAIGAAISGAIAKEQPSKRLNGIVLRNSNSLSIGFSTADGRNAVTIPRGALLPASGEKHVSTYMDYQENGVFDVTEGERQMAADNKKLGTILKEGIQRALKGVPEIVIRMNLDDGKMLKVSAEDLVTGVKVNTTLQKTGNLTAEQLDKILRDAEANKEADELKRKRAPCVAALKHFIERALLAFPRVEELGDEEKKVFYATHLKEASGWLEAHGTEDPQVYVVKNQELRAALNQVLPDLS